MVFLVALSVVFVRLQKTGGEDGAVPPSSVVTRER